MTKRKETERGYCLKLSESHLCALKARAKAANLSFKQYLVVAGLADGRTHDPEGLELRERAVFEIRWAVHELGKINRRLDRSFEVSSEKINSALEQTTEAAKLLGVAFNEPEATPEDR